MSFTSLVGINQSSLSITKMNDDKLIIITTTLSYLIVSLIIHIIFFLTTIFNNKWHSINISKHLFHRYFKQTHTKNMNSG
jgi:hypothetical protein